MIERCSGAYLKWFWYFDLELLNKPKRNMDVYPIIQT